MTLAVSTNRVDYTGNGSTNLYAFTFPTFSATDLDVIVADLNGTETVLVLNTDYSVQGLNPSGGPAETGTITLINASQAWLTGGNLTVNYTLTILREVPVEQNTSIRNQGDFFPETIENSLDYLTMIDQQIVELLDRAVTLPIAVSPQEFDPILPDNILSGAGLVLTVNSTGDGWVLSASTTGLIGIPVPISQGGTGNSGTTFNGVPTILVSAIVFRSPNGSRFAAYVDDNGEWTTQPT